MEVTGVMGVMGVVGVIGVMGVIRVMGVMKVMGVTGTMMGNMGVITDSSRALLVAPRQVEGNGYKTPLRQRSTRSPSDSGLSSVISLRTTLTPKHSQRSRSQH
jgi:hypothetical protein